MIYANPGATFPVAAQGFDTGLVGTIGVQLLRGAEVVVARTTAGIVEAPAGSGIYQGSLVAPTGGGTYLAVWDDGAGESASEQVQVANRDPQAPAYQRAYDGPVLGAELEPAVAELRLRAMLAADDEPLLSDGEVDQLLASARRMDRAGYPPDHSAWTPTYALPMAAADGWLWKAGRAAGSVDVTADDASVKASQLRAHCLEQARLYRVQGGILSVPLEGGRGRRGDDGAVANLAEVHYPPGLYPGTLP